MTLTSLPPELLGMILQYLPYASDMNALSQTCRRLQQVATAPLYANFAQTFAPHSLSRLARNGNADALRKLLSDGANLRPYIKTPYAESDLLTLAAAGGNVDVIKTLVEAYGPACLKEEKAERKVSTVAAEKGQIDVLRYLLEAGVQLARYNTVSGKLVGRDCLSHAAGANQLSSLRFLLEDAMCDVNAATHGDNHSALYWASRSGHLEAVKFLLEAGADPKCRSNLDSPFTPLHAAAMYDHAPVVEYLLEQGAYQDFEEDINATSLAFAATMSKSGLVTKILDVIDWDKILPTLSSLQRDYLLFCAALYDSDVLARRILEKPCNALRRIPRPGPNGSFCSALKLAAYHGNVALTRELLGRLSGLETSRAYKRYASALCYAIYNKQLSTVKTILDSGGKKLIDEYGVKALMISSVDEGISQELCARGALDRVSKK